MYKLFDPYKTGIVGPRFEHAVRNAMLTIMCEKGSTFVELMRALTDARYVQELLPKVTDPIIRRYWTDQIAQTSDFHKSEVLDYITSKFGRFVTNKMIRNIIGQSVSSFSFRDVMDNGKILLINLAKGELGEENSNFLGLILVPRVLMAAMSRVDMPMEQRKDFYFYVDEFQNFATPDFAVILSEARKYRLGLCVANQFIGQVEEEVKNAVFGNVGTIVAFRVGVTDANYLAHEFAPVFGEDDLLNVERYHAYIKTIVNSIELSDVGGTDLGQAIVNSANLLINSDKGKSIILLSDGQNNIGMPLQEAIDYANIRGVIIYTIGLGNEINEPFLKTLVSEKDNYFFAPSAQNLKTIYDNISSDICQEIPARIEISYKIFGTSI